MWVKSQKLYSRIIIDTQVKAIQICYTGQQYCENNYTSIAVPFDILELQYVPKKMQDFPISDLTRPVLLPVDHNTVYIEAGNFVGFGKLAKLTSAKILGLTRNNKQTSGIRET